MSAGDQVTKASVEGNELSRIDQLERDVATLRAMVMNLGSLDQATENIGSVTQGEWRFKDDNDKLRMIISAISILAEFGIDAHFAGFDLYGNPQFWASADTGKLAGGGGDVTIGDDGMALVNGVPIELKSGSSPKSFIFAPQNDGNLVLISNAASGVNLIANPGFETGNKTNWDMSGALGAQVVSDHVHSGSYSLSMRAVYDYGPVIYTDRFAVTAGKMYRCEAYSDRGSGGSYAVSVEYYDAPTGGSLIKTFVMMSTYTRSLGWQRSIGLPSVAPAGATHARLKVNTSYNAPLWLDDFYFGDAGDIVWMRSHADGWKIYRDDVECALMPPWQPFAYPIHFSSTAAFTSNTTLPANGGSVAIPIQVTGLLKLASVSIRQGSSTGPREWGWDLYTQVRNKGDVAENTLTRVAQSDGTDLFTPSAASIRTLAASSVVTLSPGIYWLVVQCRNATNAFALGSAVASATFSPSHCQTKTTTNPNGATLDFVAATWTKLDVIHAARLNGIVFGQAAVF